MSKTVLYFNESGFNSDFQKLEVALDKAKDLLAIAPELQITNSGEFNELLREPKTFIFKKLVGKETNLNGLKIEPEKGFDLIEKSQNILNLLATIEQSMRDKNSFYDFLRWFDSYPKFFAFKSNSVSLTKEAEKELRLIHSVFTENRNQENAYNEIKGIIEKLKSYSESSNESFETLTNRLFKGYLVSELEPNYTFITKL